MGRLGRLREDLRPRAVLVGVATGVGLLVIEWLSLVSVGLRPIGGNPIAVTVLLVVLQVLPWLVGGATAGFLSAGRRRRSVVNGWASGFTTGFVLGAVAGFLVVAGAEPGPTSGQAALLGRVLVLAVGVGLLLSLVGAVGGLLGYEVQHRRSPLPRT